MEEVRKFRWTDEHDTGFDVVDGRVYQVNEGKVASFPTKTRTLSELEEYDADPYDKLKEIREVQKDLVKIQKTRVLLVKGEVTDLKDAIALRDALTEAINEWNQAGWQ